MDRKEFIEKLGLGAAFVLTSTCLGSCTKKEDDDPVNPPSGGGGSGIDFTVDISAPENSNLNTNGGYIIRNSVVIARDIDGNYVAATQICSHESLNQIILENNEWHCTAHGARFALNGDGLNSNGAAGLTVYNTELSGNNLRIYS